MKKKALISIGAVVRAADMFNHWRIELLTGAFMLYPPMSVFRG